MSTLPWLTLVLKLIDALMELVFPKRKDDVASIYDRVKSVVYRWETKEGGKLSGTEKFKGVINEIERLGICKEMPLRDVNWLVETAVAEFSRRDSAYTVD